MLRSRIYIIVALIISMVDSNAQPLNINLNNWTSISQMERYRDYLRIRSSKEPFTGVLFYEVSKMEGDTTTTYVYAQYENGKKNGWEVYERTGYLGTKRHIFIKYADGEKVDTSYSLYYNSGDIKKMEIYSSMKEFTIKASYEFYNRVPSDTSSRFNQVKYYYHREDTILKTYDEQGNLKRESFYESGKSITQRFDEKGQRISVERYLNHRGPLRWQKSYYPGGSLKEDCVGGGYDKQCTYYENDGSMLQVPDSIILKLSDNGAKPFQFKRITEMRLINNYEDWRFNIQLDSIQGNDFHEMIREQSFALTLDDSISSWFLSFVQGKDNTFFLLFINDSTYVEFTERCCLGRNTVVAVSFNDVDNDGSSDISYIYNYISGVGPIDVRNQVHTIGSVYLNKENGFENYLVEKDEGLTMKQLFEEVRLKVNGSKH